MNVLSFSMASVLKFPSDFLSKNVEFLQHHIQMGKR